MRYEYSTELYKLIRKQNLIIGDKGKSDIESISNYG